MNSPPARARRQPEWPFVPIAVLVLGICTFYTYAQAFLAPCPGLTVNTEWVVIQVDPCSNHPGWCKEGPAQLRPGDQLTAIGTLTHERYQSDRRRVPFEGYGPGDKVLVRFRRDGQARAIVWHMPQVAPRDRMLGLRGLVFYLPFWLVGTTALLFLRLRDRRWRLGISWSYLTAIWRAHVRARARRHS